MRKPLQIELARDDGETLGELKRPVGGFKVSSGWSLFAPERSTSEGEDRSPSQPDEAWLSPRDRPESAPWGQPETVPWPRSDGGWVRSFADLHRGSDGDIAAFAGRWGWLRFGTLIAPAPLDPGFVPVWGDRISTWRRESSALGELLNLLDCSRRVGAGQAPRQQVLRHFTGDDGASLWLRAGDRMTRRSGRGDWCVEPGASGTGPPVALAFVWRAREDILFVRMPVKGAPEPGSNLAVVDPAALGVLARHAVGSAIQQALTKHTAAALTLTEGIRVAPRTLLGAIYLSLARELFNRRGQRVCPVCRQPFMPKRRDQIYCNFGGSQACRSKFNRTEESA
ncbi:MAG TPA: hypothetical protein VNH20_07045 [Candidatus Dormibacteraeota bacterium]|nr:hypothetical protein [Candidatus Dormibacteraeota bacterium]